MVKAPRHVLVVGTEPETVDRVAPMLRRADFEVHNLPASPFILDVIVVTRFELIVVAFPLPDEMPLEQLIQAVRQDGSNCRDAGMMLLAASDQFDAAAEWVDRGINRVVGTDWADARLWQAIGDLLSVEPRVAIRALVEIELGAERDHDIELLRTVNVSRTGMLLTGGHQLHPGTRFSFTMAPAGEASPMQGSAEVVRLAGEIDGGKAFAARFLGFKDDSAQRLAATLDRAIASNPPAE